MTEDMQKPVLDAIDPGIDGINVLRLKPKALALLCPEITRLLAFIAMRHHTVV